MNAYNVYQIHNNYEYQPEQVKIVKHYLILAINQEDAQYIFQKYMQPKLRFKDYNISHSSVLTRHLAHMTQRGYFRDDDKLTVENFQSIRELVINEILEDL